MVVVRIASFFFFWVVVFGLKGGVCSAINELFSALICYFMHTWWLLDCNFYVIIFALYSLFELWYLYDCECIV